MRLVHYSDEGGDAAAASGVGTDGDRDGRAADGRRDTGAVDGDRNVLATDVDVAKSLASQTRGLMFRRSFSDGSALVFRFGTAKTRDVHMLFVFFPIDAVWVVDDVVRRVERLRPWRSFAREECDLLVELPAGTADGVESGDRLVLEDE